MARILIVDDERAVVDTLAEFLSGKGHEVVSAGDPIRGLQAARRFEPEIVLLDYHMPGDTGAHLFEAFRRNQKLKDIPILFMSGSKTEEELAAEVASREKTAYLMKPVRFDDLERTIDDLLA
ncbi:MAG: response regulator [Elusimicrobiota bacterium]